LKSPRATHGAIVAPETRIACIGIDGRSLRVVERELRFDGVTAVADAQLGAELGDEGQAAARPSLGIAYGAQHVLGYAGPVVGDADGGEAAASEILTRKRGRSTGGPPFSSEGGGWGFVPVASGTLAWVVSPPSPAKLEGAAEAPFEGPLELVVLDVPLTTALAREVIGPLR